MAVIRAAMATLACALLPACGSDVEPPAHREHGFGTADLGRLHVRAVRLVTAGDDGAVALVATFVNDGPADVLTEVSARPGDIGTADGVPSASVTSSRRPGLDLGAAQIVVVGGSGRPRIDLPDPGERIRAGFLATVTLSFRGAGTSRVEVIVEEPRGFLAPYAPRGTWPGHVVTGLRGAYSSSGRPPSAVRCQRAPVRGARAAEHQVLGGRPHSAPVTRRTATPTTGSGPPATW